MAFDLDRLDDDVLQFLTDRHLATLTVVRADGSPHVAPVGFAYDTEERLVRIIARAGSRKVEHVQATGRGAVCQVHGGRWLTLEGPIRVARGADAVAAAVAAYAARYRDPRERADRVALELSVERIMGRVPLHE